ncbi:signal transduction histidine kinase [Isoptericola jiangsuensis]|uniref:histidine kinase n=2 Tax=Isoptericola jiangsuensis TaxID=548579 RepID=A0A2A9ETY1_9MICO|nr:signal transduction histidine kinase [Isoptericola jiangsuensis]
MALIYVPIALILLLLGMFYVVSITRAHHQEVFLDRLRDAAYLSITARQSILTDDPTLVQIDLDRYHELYGVRAAVVDQAGDPVAVAGLDVREVPERAAALAGHRAELTTDVWPWDTDDIVVAEPVFDGGDVVGALVTSSDTAQVRRGIWYSWAILIAGGVVTALLALLVADRTAGWVLRPVRAVDRAMEQMGSGRLDERIPASTGPPELRQVVERFNEMAERVEHLMRRQQEFVANASHELRNPLSALMLRIEALALSVPADSTAEVEHVRAEAEHMAQILDALLLLAEDAATGPVQPLDVVDLVERHADGWRLLDPAREFTVRSAPGALWGAADPTALGAALDTIVDNALKFSPAATPVEVEVRADGRMVEVTVRDHGPGVPADQLDRLTDRFWRSPGHSAVRGSGLGLAIASELLASAGGGLRLELPDGGGLRAHLLVPSWEDPA